MIYTVQGFAEFDTSREVENMLCEQSVRWREYSGMSAVQGAGKHSVLISERVGNVRVREL